MAIERILVTNDDGVFSEGIKLLAEVLTEIAEVTVVAPDREQSADLFQSKQERNRGHGAFGNQQRSGNDQEAQQQRDIQRRAAQWRAGLACVQATAAVARPR